MNWPCHKAGELLKQVCLQENAFKKRHFLMDKFGREGPFLRGSSCLKTYATLEEETNLIIFQHIPSLWKKNLSSGGALPFKKSKSTLETKYQSFCWRKRTRSVKKKRTALVSQEQEVTRAQVTPMQLHSGKVNWQRRLKPQMLMFQTIPHFSLRTCNCFSQGLTTWIFVFSVSSAFNSSSRRAASAAA